MKHCNNEINYKGEWIRAYLCKCPKGLLNLKTTTRAKASSDVPIPVSSGTLEISSSTDTVGVWKFRYFKYTIKLYKIN